MINTVIEELMGIRHTSLNQMEIDRKEGIFGWVSNYIGTVKVQGQGMLHFHTVIWLEGAPTAEWIRELLQTESFWEKVVGIIKVNIKGDVEGLPTGTITNLEHSKEVSYSWPLNPRQMNYALEKTVVENHLVSALQFHQCTKEACLILKKQATSVNKMHHFNCQTTAIQSWFTSNHSLLGAPNLKSSSGLNHRAFSCGK